MMNLPESVATDGTPLPPGLYVVGTPIGNLEDITLRALRTLKTAGAILAEDTRHTKRLLDRYGIQTPMISCHKFNERSRADEICRRISLGESVALVSDAGMPGISDPGARTVQAVREAGFPVTAIPGPTALATAVALSGCTEHQFHFEGFLDHKTAARRRRLQAWREADFPVVLYESPFRLLKLMEEVEEELSPERTLFVARELTKKFEEVLTGTPADIRAHFQNRTVKGELVVIIYPADTQNHRAKH